MLAAVFSAQNVLATGSDDAFIRLWQNTGPNQWTMVALLTGHDEPVNSLAFSRDGDLLVSGGRDETIRFWNVNESIALGARDLPNTAQVVLGGSEEWVRSVALSPDGRYLASTSSPSFVRLWDLGAFGRGGNVLPGHQGTWVYALAVSADGLTLASGGEDRTVRLWSLETHSESGTLLGHTARVNAVAFNRDGSRVASASSDGTVRVWDPSHPGEALRVFDAKKGKVLTLVFTPDGKAIVAGGSDGTLRFWSVDQDDTADKDVPDRQIENVFPEKIAVWTIAVSPNGRWLAAAGDDGIIRVLELSDLSKPAGEFKGHRGPVWALAFTPDSKRLASGGRDRIVRLWNPENSQEKPKELVGHDGEIRSIAFHYADDEQLMVTGSNDQTLRLWDLTHPDFPPAVLGGAEEWVRAVTFALDGKIIAGASADGTIRLWTTHTSDLAEQVCNLVGYNLSSDQWELFVDHADDIPSAATCPGLPVLDATTYP